MARNMKRISLVVCVLAARCVGAQEILGKLIATDALFSNIKREVIHSHLERMLQMEPERDELENARRTSKTGAQSSNTKLAAPSCKGPDCFVAPTSGKDAGIEVHAPSQKVVTYGPMTQEAFQRLVQRKRTALRQELQKKGTLSSELNTFLEAASGTPKDAFGIPLPAGPSAPRPRSDFEMRFQPQAPSPDPAIAAAVKSSTSSSSSSSTSSKPNEEMDSKSLRSELEAFLAASPVPQHILKHAASNTATASSASTTVTTTNPSASTSAAPRPTNVITTTTTAATNTTNATKGITAEQAKTERQRPQDPVDQQKQLEQQQTAANETKAAVLPSTGGAIISGPARPPMTEQESARMAAQQAANAIAREAAMAHKRRIVREEFTSSANNKGKRTAASSLSSSSSNSGLMSAASKKRTAAATRKTSYPPSSWGVMGVLCIALLAVAAAAALFVAAAVMEDALLSRPSGVKNAAAVATSALPAHWMALTHSLWRRCRRALAAARKQLTGHGSDLPMSSNEGSGTLARAVSAASTFVQVFWIHLRHQPLGGAVTAALDASRRASIGGAVSDRSSAGGASTSSYYSSPFASADYQQQVYGGGSAAAPFTSYVIEADGSATAIADGCLRRRH